MSLESRVYALREAGAASYDAADLRFIESLLARAEQASAGTRARLKDRARRHLFALELRFAAARRLASDAIVDLAATTPDAAEKARALADEGDVLGARQLAERVRARLSSLKWRRAADRLERVLDLAEERCQPAPPDVAAARALLLSPDVEGDAARRAHALANALTLCLLKEGAERSCAQLEVDRLQRSRLVEAGPYNPDALMAQALDEIAALSPLYLRAYLAWAGDLEALLKLPPSPAETSKPEKKGRRR